MDDILLFISKAMQTDFVENFRQNCYWPPLSLEDGNQGTFLETIFKKTLGGTITHRLKNGNEDSLKIWRYHHYQSALDYGTKRGILASCLKKVEKMASNPSELRISALAKCAEFLALGYPIGILKFFCGTRARESGLHTWYEVSRRLDSKVQSPLESYMRYPYIGDGNQGKSLP